MKWFHLLSQLWNLLCSMACSLYFEWWIWDGRAQNLAAHRMSMHKNWLLVVWACEKIGYLVSHFGAPHAFSELLCSTCHSFLCPLLLSLSTVLCPMSPSLLCLISYVPCLMSLFLIVSRPLAHRVHRVATAAFWRTFSDEGKISPGWWGWGVHAHPLSLHLPSPVKLQCTLQLSRQIHWPCFISTNLCTLCSVHCLTSLFLVSRPLYSVLRLCSLSPIFCSLYPRLWF